MTDVGDISVRIKVETAQLKQSLNEANKQIKKFGQENTRQLGSMTTAFKAIGAAMAAAFARSAIGGIKEAADALEEITLQAAQLGLTTKAFQELTVAARLLDVSQESLTTHLAIFSRNLGQARSGVGPLVEQMGKLNPHLQTALQHSTSLDEALMILSQGFASTASAQDKAALSMAAFGRGGAEMTRLMGSGLASVRAEAEKLDQVFTKAELKIGAELSDTFTNAGASIKTNLYRTLLDLAPAITSLVNSVKDLVQLIRDLGEGLGVFAMSFGSQIKRVKGDIDSLDTQLAKLIKSRDELINAENSGNETWLNKLLGARVNFEEQIATKLTKRAELEKQLLEIQQQQMGQGFADSTHIEKPVPKAHAVGPSKEDYEAALKELQGFHAEALRATEKFSEAVKVEYEDQLKHLKEQLDKGLINQQQFEAARADLAKINAKKMKEAYEEENKVFVDGLNTIGSALESEFSNFLETGKFSIKDFVQSALKDLAKLMVKLALLNTIKGIGGLGNLSGLLGFSEGGEFNAGKPIMVGEKGPEIMVPGKGGTVIPNHQLSGGGGSNVRVNIINNSGAPVQERRSNQGGVNVVEFIIGKVKEQMASGSFDPVLTGRYNLNPALTRR